MVNILSKSSNILIKQQLNKSFKKNYKLLIKHKYILFLFLLTIIPFSALFLSNTLWDAELHRIALYYYTVSYDTARNFGELALWNPLEMSGHPFLGNSQIHIFYPLILPFYFINPIRFITLIIAIHIFLASFFTYLLCRKIGASEFGAFIAGLAFVFSGPVMVRISAGHMGIIYSTVWIPLLFLLTIKLYENWRFFILLAWTLSIFFLAGYPQVFHFTIIALTLFLLFYIFCLNNAQRTFFEKSKALFFYGLSLALMGLLVLFLLIPSFTMMKESLRSEGTDFDFVASNSLHFENLITFLIPRFFLNEAGRHLGAGPLRESAVYIGIIPLLLSLLGLSALRKHRILFFFLCLLIISILIALGKNTPLLLLLYKFVPGFNLFRVPLRILILFVFSLAIFASFGADYLAALLTKLKYTEIIIVSLLILTTGALSAVLFLKLFEGNLLSLFTHIFELKLQSNFSNYGLDYYFAGIPAMLSNLTKGVLIIACMLGAACGTFILYYYKKISLNKSFFLISLFIITDLLLFNIPFFRLSAPDTLYFSSKSAEAIAEDDSLYRVWDLSEDYPYWLTWKYGAQQIGGHEPLLYKKYKQFYNWMIYQENLDPAVTWFESINATDKKCDANLLNLLNVKYIFTKDRMENSSFILTNKVNNIFIYENKNNLPRAFIVGAIRSTPNIEKELRAFNPKKEALIEGNETQWMLGSEFKEANIIAYSPNSITIQTELDKPGVLIVSELYFPGWRALDNGKETNVFRMNYVFRGIILSKGSHEIELFFKPAYFNVMIGISLFSFLLSLTALLYFWKYAPLSR